MKSRILKVKENESFFEQIKTFSNYTDWKITVIYYTALHIIDAIAIKEKKISSHGFHDHSHRETVLSKVIPVWSNYYNNKKYSLSARYTCIIDSHGYAEILKQDNLKYSIQNLEIIKKHAKSIDIQL
jgi:hypothetical protein